MRSWWCTACFVTSAARSGCMTGGTMGPTVLSMPVCSAACQEKNDGLYMLGTGRQYNEPNETFWAAIGQLGVTTQVFNCWLLAALFTLSVPNLQLCCSLRTVWPDVA